jgi:hypothetical protein
MKKMKRMKQVRNMKYILNNLKRIVLKNIWKIKIFLIRTFNLSPKITINYIKTSLRYF